MKFSLSGGGAAIAAGLAGLSLATSVAAQVATIGEGAPAEPVVVVELYTSQGCSSCPPADELLESLAANPGVIPLALHVDYWDYIGWTDSFAQAKFTDRQKAYARAEGTRTIYTPQLVIDGVGRAVGSDREEVLRLIRAEMERDRPVALWVRRDGEALVIQAELKQASSVPMFVQLVRYKPAETVAIERGENAGRTVTYTNIVTEWTKIGSWTGAEPLDISVMAPGADEAVVIIQTEGPGRILAAMRAD